MIEKSGSIGLALATIAILGQAPRPGDIQERPPEGRCVWVWNREKASRRVASFDQDLAAGKANWVSVSS
ncbi:MAG: hypothetical protein ACRERS_06020 [Methylococcales bacterium]